MQLFLKRFGLLNDAGKAIMDLGNISVIEVKLPVSKDDLKGLSVGDRILVSGKVYAGRDSVLPKVCCLVEQDRLRELDADFVGNALLHTAVSGAGIGPTSSNKLEIEESFSGMCKAGIRLFLGKGFLSAKTVDVLREAGAVFAVVPPTTALFERGMSSKRLVAFPELGMEALWELELKDVPAVVAIAHGLTLF